MRRLLLSLLGVVVSIASVNAGKLTAQQALQKAQQFLGGKSVVTVESNKTLTRSLGDAPAFYIFNARDNEGFVIVSADDRTEAVLGYSYHGTFSLDDMPDNLRWWLSVYTEQIKSMADDYQPSEKATTRAAKSAILPLITTTWNQYEPYNLQCPEYGGQKCLTGCTATALAQVLYYYKWPSSCSSLPAYVTNKLKLSVPELPATAFKWDRMKTSYAYGENSGTAAEAVAELLRYCGQANEMDYTPSASGANIHEDVMINSFNYSKNMRRILRDDFAQDHWESIIYNELAENRPVLYAGYADPGSNDEGHQFICDGYDGNGKYHMNWGWGGHCDGYYLLSACNPESQGEPTGRRYNTGQHANIGFKPAVEGEVIIPDLQSDIQDYFSQSFTRTSGKSDFENIPLYAWIFAVYKVSPESPFHSEVGWGLYQGENLIQTFSAGSVVFEAKNYAYARNKLSVSFGKDLKDGKYQFRQIYKDQITQDWTLCSRYISNSLIVEIAGTSMTVRMIDNRKVKFSVGNLRCSDMPAVGMPVTVTADVTNLGEANYLTACLWSQKEGETTWPWHNEFSQYVNVDQEKTAGIEFQFTPVSAGNFNLKITSNVSEDALATAKIEVSAVEKVTQDGVSYSCMQAYHTAKIMSADRESTPEELTIPSTVKTSDGTECKVLSIERSAFANNVKIKKLIISEGVESIGNYAFDGSDFEKVELPSTLTYLGQYAFASTRSLVTVISRSVNPATVDENTFTSSARRDSESGETIYEPTAATLYIPVGSKSAYQSKGWSAFAKIEEGEPFETVIGGLKYLCSPGSKTATVIQGDYSELESVDIPATISVDKVKYKVKAIGNRAFSSCWNLKTLTLAEGIESIGNRSFQRIGVSELSLPSTLKSIGDGAFEYSYIKSLVIPEGVESISNYAFYGSSFEKLSLPSTLKSIGDDAFGYIYNIKSLVIPEGVESIGNYAFDGSDFEKVELPSTLTYLGQYAFASTRSLVTVISRSVNPATVDENTFTSSARRDSESGETIYEPTAATLYIPVGSKSAYQSKGWADFSKIEEGEPFETVVGDLKYLCSPGSKTATVIQGDYSELESVDIPATISVDKVKYKVKAIGNSAFGDCWNLKTLTLAEGIESIGNRSFQSIGVTDLSLPSTLKSIGDEAFEYIYIKSLVIPEGVENIGNYAFFGSGFEKVELPSTLTSIGGFVFGGCNYLTSVTSYSTDPQNVNTNAFVTEKYDQDLQQLIHEPLSAILNVPVGTKKKYKQADGWKEFKNIVEVGEAVSITISAAQQLAYYSDKALDFTLYPELKAYVATGYAKSGTIWLTRVKKVPAETGFLLMGDEGDYEIPVSESTSDCYYKNLFKGTLEGATIQTTEDGFTNYYLSKGDYGVSFYKVGASGVTLGANRAYLSVPSDIPAVGTAGGTETIKVSAALLVPYYSANSLDFTDMELKGLKAYTATGYDYEKGTIWLSRVKQVPAETGILIMADKAGDYDVPKASVASVYENMFMGTLGGKTIQTEETIAGEDYINYYLSKGDYGISFYKVGASGVTLGENRCYLPIPVRESSASGTRSFSSEADQITILESDEVIGIPLYRGIESDEDGTTGVKEVKSGDVKGEEWYTLQGQCVAKPGKGLYIKNGKKVLVKTNDEAER